MAATKRVAVVSSSTRPTRICPGIAAWIHQALRDLPAPDEPTPLEYELLDLADVDLPFLDEPLMPALGQYAHEHTKAWSRLVDQYDGFLFVLPQYNWGYPAVLKNALDFLYREWNNKAAGFVSYGGAGGARAVEHLRLVMSELMVATVRAQVMLSLITDFEKFTTFKPLPQREAELATVLDQVVSWARALKMVR